MRAHIHTYVIFVHMWTLMIHVYYMRIYVYLYHRYTQGCASSPMVPTPLPRPHFGLALTPNTAFPHPFKTEDHGQHRRYHDDTLVVAAFAYRFAPSKFSLLVLFWWQWTPRVSPNRAIQITECLPTGLLDKTLFFQLWFQIYLDLRGPCARAEFCHILGQRWRPLNHGGSGWMKLITGIVTNDVHFN